MELALAQIAEITGIEIREQLVAARTPIPSRRFMSSPGAEPTETAAHSGGALSIRRKWPNFRSTCEERSKLQPILALEKSEEGKLFPVLKLLFEFTGRSRAVGNIPPARAMSEMPKVSTYWDRKMSMGCTRVARRAGT